MPAGATEGSLPMLIDMIDVFAAPETYVCIWNGGELYIRPAAALPAAAENIEEAHAL
jgi:hypothetical protein